MGDVKVPEDLQSMFQQCAEDPCDEDFDNSVVQRLIERIGRAEQRVAELQRENTALQEQLRDEALAFKYANEIVGKLEAEIAALRAPVTEAEKPRKIIISHAQVDSDVVAIYGGLPNHFLNSFGSDEEAQTWIDSGEAKKKDALMSQRASAQHEKGNGNG